MTVVLRYCFLRGTSNVELRSQKTNIDSLVERGESRDESAPLVRGFSPCGLRVEQDHHI
jgi:hypothetical protein